MKPRLISGAAHRYRPTHPPRGGKPSGPGRLQPSAAGTTEPQQQQAVAASSFSTAPRRRVRESPHHVRPRRRTHESDVSWKAEAIDGRLPIEGHLTTFFLSFLGFWCIYRAERVARGGLFFLFGRLGLGRRVHVLYLFVLGEMEMR